VNHPAIKKSTLTFLKNLHTNNDRDWFNEHKDQYLLARENAEQFMDVLLYEMSKHDQFDTPSGKKSLYRVYKDVRFSNNKQPYNPWLSAYLRRAKPLLRGGYYFRIMPGASRVTCGFSFPKPEDLYKIRMDISANYKHWKKLLNTKIMRDNFGAIIGEQVKTTPRGFSSDDPAIELLRHKQFLFRRHFTDKEVLAPDFLLTVNKTCKVIRPLFDYMSELLTTDSNGVSLF